MTSKFSINCRRCNRLAEFLDDLRVKYPDYHNLPVPAFGPTDAQLLIVGLAPGLHGANATGRPFTGDYAGLLLYETLFKYGFSSQSESVAADDGLTLINCRITNSVRCLPPGNKPIGEEVNLCNSYLSQDLTRVPKGGVIIALGVIAHRAVIKSQGLKLSDYPFSHGAEASIPGSKYLISSYHCSRYNTQTKRLTSDMFSDIFITAKSYLDNFHD
ncbi:MAG: uracil-DNA glycosylase [Pseudomonadota bacterium]|nr:uracil-DNA glycosylase [Pseudomonadota bacterium]